MFKVGISGDLLNNHNEPCFGNAPLELLKKRKEVFWITLRNGSKFRVFWPEIWTKWQIPGKRSKPGPPNKIIFFDPEKEQIFHFTT